MRSKRSGQLLQSNELTRCGFEIEQRTPKGEFVARNVSAVEDNAAPIVFRAWSVRDERWGHG